MELAISISTGLLNFESFKIMHLTLKLSTYSMANLNVNETRRYFSQYASYHHPTLFSNRVIPIYPPSLPPYSLLVHSKTINAIGSPT